MRAILILSVLAGSTAVADASSIESFQPTASERSSIVVIGCPDCRKTEAAAEAKKPELAPGSQIRELREVDGQMMLYTTENWLGGSPVTIVRKATDVDLARFAPDRPADPATAVAEERTVRLVKPAIAHAGGAPARDPGVDAEATTGALAQEEAFDPSKFELRLH